MNKKDLIDSVAEMNDMAKTDVKEVLEATLETIEDGLSEGEEVELFGFGKFYTSMRSARKGRNPQTGAEIDIPAVNQVKFKPAKKLKDSVK